MQNVKTSKIKNKKEDDNEDFQDATKDEFKKKLDNASKMGYKKINETKYDKTNNKNKTKKKKKKDIWKKERVTAKGGKGDTLF